MATRMQQRRGTAAQWTAANPILAAGEIGFETDTSKFKMGNGSSTWSALQYFANAAELAAIVDGAPGLLNTLNELAASIGDDPDFIGTVTAHTSDTTNVHGIADTSLLATIAGTEAAIADSRATSALDATSKANGAIAAAALDATAKVTTAAEAAASALGAHEAETTDVHGIANTANLAVRSEVATAKDEAISESLAAASLDATTKVSTAIAALTKGSVGLDQVDNTSDANKPVSTAQATAIADAVSDHNLDETNVHGIADTSELVTQTQLTNAINGAEVDQSALAGNGLVWDSANSEFDLDNTYITTATQDALDLKAPLANPTFTGTVSGITKTMVGLGDVDNTADLAKPVSTATQTALNLKANLAGATFTGDVTVETDLIVDGNLTVTGTTTTVSAQDLVVSDPLIYIGEGNTGNLVDLGLVSNFNDGTYQHSGIVRDSSAGKWKIFKGVTDEPTTTVNFTQGSLDALEVGAFEATTVTASSGIVFSDGTQTKVGVPSVTTFATAISSSATLATGEADKFVPLTGAVTITLPATGYSTGQSIDFYQASGTGAQFSNANGVVGTPGLKFRTTNSVVTAMKTSSGWLVFGDLSA